MYSWRTLRALCVLLLLLPVVHLVYLLSRDTMDLLESSPEAWNRELEAYAREDSANHLPTDPIVVVGGKRVRLWYGLEEFLTPRPVLMRGLGDATVDDIVYNYSALIGFYRPKSLVLLPSNSEFHIRDNKGAEELFRGIRKLVQLDASHDVTRHIYIFSPIKTPLYPGDDEIIDRVTALLDTWAQQKGRVTFLDANAILANGDGRPKPDYFRSDGVNLNDHGYLRLSLLLRSQLELDERAGKELLGSN
jgi:hypothetical protein